MTQGNNPKFCGQCGSAIAPNDRFCSGCGKNLSSELVARSYSSDHKTKGKYPVRTYIIVGLLALVLIFALVSGFIAEFNKPSRAADSTSTINNSTSCDDLLVEIKEKYGSAEYVRSKYFSISNNAIDSECKQALNEINSLTDAQLRKIFPPTPVRKPTSLPTNTPVPSPCTNGNYEQHGIELKSEISCNTKSREITWTVSPENPVFADYRLKGTFYNNYWNDFRGVLKYKVYDSQGYRLDDKLASIGPVGPGETTPFENYIHGDIGQIILYKISRYDNY